MSERRWKLCIRSDMTHGMEPLRERLERGYAMRAERLAEGALLAAAFATGDLRPAYAAFMLLALQAFVSPLLGPVALLWTLFERRLPVHRLGNLYFDVAGARGGAAVSCMVMALAFALDRFAGWHAVALAVLGLPCASCILSGTVGFCAGCGYYVLVRDLLARAGLVARLPEGARDVDIERD